MKMIESFLKHAAKTGFPRDIWRSVVAGLIAALILLPQKVNIIVIIILVILIGIIVDYFIKK